MSEETVTKKSLIEQIMDEMFASIEKREEFEEKTLLDLKHLARTEGLKKPAQVTKAIKGTTGETA